MSNKVTSIYPTKGNWYNIIRILKFFFSLICGKYYISLNSIENFHFCHSSRIPHGNGLLVYFTDDKNGRYNYSGKFEEGEISSLEGGTTFYRNGNTYQGQYSGQGNSKGLPEGRGVLR